MKSIYTELYEKGMQAKHRRTPGRTEDPQELEEQLTEGLLDSFPCSDPVSVVSTAIPGGCKVKDK